MKEVKRYICDQCGAEFESLYDCTEHEKTHLFPAEYLLHYKRASTVPEEINVIFKDGTQQCYYLPER